jgi:histidine kinase
VVVDDARVPCDAIPGLSNDSYVKGHAVKSLLCIPLKVGAGTEVKVIGILYLENRVASAVFTAQRVEVLEIICLAAAGRLELSLKAATDGLTGLYNHEYFQNILTKEMLQSRRQLRNLSLIMVDIDHFKKFNDNHGHQVGDLVLKKVAKSIQTVCRGSDVVARYGGEEISIILPETDAERAVMVAERIRAAIASSSIQIDGQSLKVTASLGVSSLGDDIADSETLLRVADKALYTSKDLGRNRVTQAVATPRLKKSS